MTAIQVIENPVLEGTRRALVLAEDRVGHYSEFRDFFVRQFALDTGGLSHPGYVRAPSGMTYAFLFIGRSGEPFPDGIEIYALPSALEPLNDSDVDADLWALLRWVVAGVGGEWRVDDFDATGRLYQLSVAESA
jgi:hypothetical protein